MRSAYGSKSNEAKETLFDTSFMRECMSLCNSNTDNMYRYVASSLQEKYENSKFMCTHYLHQEGKHLSS